MNSSSGFINEKFSYEETEKFNAELEKRVIERTVSLSKENKDLKKEIAQCKSVQEQTKKSLQERIILLKGIHHTVKNNFQVISSLLNIQSGYIKDEECLEFLRESSSRVRSMALLYEKLYESHDLHTAELGKYINSLCKDLFNSYNIDSNRINFKSNLNRTFLEIRTAILCGLIINELISNSLKHAFPGNREGEISIEMDSYDSKYLLIVRDNGIGFPPDLDFRNTSSLGLQLINALTVQLNGEIELFNREFTEFRITFPQSSNAGFRKFILQSMLNE
jgi:two-component sensor histidine kinase